MISRVGFGAIPIQRPAKAEAVEVMHRCLDLSMTFFDTANGYTTSAERIGKAIVGRREPVILATQTAEHNLDFIPFILGDAQRRRHDKGKDESKRGR